MTAPETVPAIKQPADIAKPHHKLSLTANLIPLVAPFMPANDIRFYLNGINVRPHPDGGAVICATNGHVLAVVRDHAAVCEREVIIHLRKSTVAACAQRPLNGRLLSLIHGRIAVTEGGEDILIQPGSPIIEGTFPDYRQIVPKASKLIGGLAGGFNSQYLALLNAAVTAAGKNTGAAFHALSFFHAPDSKSSVARIEGVDEFIAVLMPMKSPPVVKSVPGWIAAIPANEVRPATKRVTA